MRWAGHVTTPGKVWRERDPSTSFLLVCLSVRRGGEAPTFASVCSLRVWLQREALAQKGEELGVGRYCGRADAESDKGSCFSPVSTRDEQQEGLADVGEIEGRVGGAGC